MRVEDEYFDVLQNLEWAIMNEFRQDRSILDQDARDAAHALVRLYEAELESRFASGARLSDRAQRIFDAVRPICEWRLGRAPAPDKVALCIGHNVDRGGARALPQAHPQVD
jgi:hypothetical protein